MYSSRRANPGPCLPNLTFDKRQSRCDINLMKITLSGLAIKQEALVVHEGATINPALDTVRIGLILIVRRTKCEIKDCRDCGCSTFYVRNLSENLVWSNLLPMK